VNLWLKQAKHILQDEHGCGPEVVDDYLDYWVNAFEKGASPSEAISLAAFDGIFLPRG
jgi:hypothetical protein